MNSPADSVIAKSTLLEGDLRQSSCSYSGWVLPYSTLRHPRQGCHRDLWRRLCRMPAFQDSSRTQSRRLGESSERLRAQTDWGCRLPSRNRVENLPERCARTCRRCFGLEATKRRSSSPRIRWSALFSSSPYENHEPHARHRIASSPRGFSEHSSACPRQSGHCRDIEWPMRAGSARAKFLRAFSTEDHRRRGASCDSRPHPSREIGRGSPVRRKSRRPRLCRILMDWRSHCPAARVRDRSR